MIYISTLDKVSTKEKEPNLFYNANYNNDYPSLTEIRLEHDYIIYTLEYESQIDDDEYANYRQSLFEKYIPYEVSNRYAYSMLIWYKRIEDREEVQERPGTRLSTISMGNLLYFKKSLSWVGDILTVIGVNVYDTRREKFYW